MTEPCVVFALGRESMFFRRMFRFQERFRSAPCRAQFRGPLSQTILMVETGLGAAAMESALRWCLQGPRFGEAVYQPRFIVSAGFSGALEASQQIGDLISATEILDLDGNHWSATHSLSDAMPSGRLLTVPQLVGDPREKQRLGQHYRADAVDMESATVARLCQEYRVPFACLRVISDDLNTPLSPHLVELLRRGRVSPSRLAWSVLRHPSLLHELWLLSKHTRWAAKRLANALRLSLTERG